MRKITIISASYNCCESIESTILSVITQDYAEIEYIIIDGGSTDGTVDIIKKYASYIYYWDSKPDKGLYDALNKGVRIATGEWIGILNCGDHFHSEHTISQMFEKDIPSDINIIYGNSVIVDGENKILRKPFPMTSNSIPPQYRHGASFIRNNIHKKYLYDISMSKKYRYALDYLHICTMFRAGLHFLYRDVTIVDYQKEGMSNHPWFNKYVRALSESGGHINLFFFLRLSIYIINAITEKVKNGL